MNLPRRLEWIPTSGRASSRARSANSFFDKPVVAPGVETASGFLTRVSRLLNQKFVISCRSDKLAQWVAPFEKAASKLNRCELNIPWVLVTRQGNCVAPKAKEAFKTAMDARLTGNSLSFNRHRRLVSFSISLANRWEPSPVLSGHGLVVQRCYSATWRRRMIVMSVFCAISKGTLPLITWLSRFSREAPSRMASVRHRRAISITASETEGWVSTWV